MQRTLGLEASKIPEVVVSALSLRYVIMRLRFHCMNDVRELDGVLDEKYWNIVANEVPYAFLGVELDGESSHISHSILQQ